MRTFRVLVLVFFGTVSLFAQKPSEGNVSNVYFYRLRDGYAAILKPSIFVDNKQVVRMRNGRFATFTLTVGEHTITSTFPGNGVVIEIKPDEKYYVRLDMTRPTMFHNARGQVTQVAEGQGKFEVSKLKPVDPEDLKVDTTPTDAAK